MNLPSIKTLSQVFGDRAKEARELLEKKRKTRDYTSVQEWEKSCYHQPSYHDRLMLALNEIAGTYGVEYIQEGRNSKSPAIEYLNTGDMYNVTLMHINGRFRVGDVGSIIEHGSYD